MSRNLDEDYARAVARAADGYDDDPRETRLPRTVAVRKPPRIEEKPRFGAGESAAVGRQAEAPVPAAAPPVRPAPPPAPAPASISIPTNAGAKIDALPPRRFTLPARTISFQLPGEMFAKLEMLARENHVMPGRQARNFVEAGLATEEPPTRPEPMVELTRKPLVRAAVLSAANEAGADLHEFCSKLIDPGLDVWRDRRREGEA